MTESKQPDSDRKPIELDDKDIEQVTGGTYKPLGGVEDPCAGGQITKLR